MTESNDKQSEDKGPEPAALNTFDRLELWDREGLAPKSFVVVLLLSTAALFYVLLPFLHDVILAFVVVGLFSPVYHRLLPAIRNPWLCSGVVSMLAVVLVAAPLVWLVLTLVEEGTQAYALVKPSLTDGSVPKKASEWLTRLGVAVTPAELAVYADSYAERLRDLAIAEGTALLNNMIAGLIHFCVIVVLVFYAFVQGGKLKAFLFKLSPLPDDQDELIMTKFTAVARGVLFGNGVGSVLQGVVGGLAMALVGLPSPVLWATVMAIAAFVPLFGISVVVIPAGIYLILQERVGEGIAFMAICLSVAAVLENILKTKLMGVGVRVHEVPLFLAVLGGLAGFGLLGLLYGPLIVAMFLTLTELYMSHYRLQFAARFARRKSGSGSMF